MEEMMREGREMKAQRFCAGDRDVGGWVEVGFNLTAKDRMEGLALLLLQSVCVLLLTNARSELHQTLRMFIQRKTRW